MWVHLPKYHFLPAPAVASSPPDHSGTESSATSSETVTVSMFCEGVLRMARSMTLQSGTMFLRLVVCLIAERWISSLPDSHVSRSASPAECSLRTTRETGGQQRPGSFARYDRDSRSWKTSQGCLLALMGISGPSSVIWPRSGMTCAGDAYPRRQLAPITGGSGCGFSLPTPTAIDYGANKSASAGAAERLSLASMARRGRWPTPMAHDGHRAVTATPESEYLRHRPCLPAMVHAVERLWPTPTVHGNYNKKGLTPSSGDGLHTAVNRSEIGRLNPAWVEWLMGWPLGHTDLRR